MNADSLIHAFSMIGEDPARIRQLRQVAVALAIAGKLNAGRAALSPREMLRAVEQVKTDLYKQRAIPKPKNLAATEQDELPENFPDAGRFAPLGRIARVEKGLTGIKQAKPGPFPLVVTGADRATCDHFDFEGAAAIVPLVSSTGHGHASLNRLHYQEGKFALGTILAAVFPYDPALMSARFIFEYLSAFKEELLVTRMTGTANVTLSVGRIAEVPVPLIDPATQAKVDELMALLDRLEAARGQREATRDRLTAASLARLTAPDTDPADFPANTRFALAMLPALTTRPDQIKPLRQTILNLAVRGKLVAQDATDEPASELLKRKFKLPNGFSRRRKIIKEASVDASEGLLSQIPATWAYVRIQDLYDAKIVIDYADGNHGSLYPRNSEFGEDGVIFVSAKDLVGGKVNWPTCSKLNRERASQLTKGWAQTGDILLTHNATVGRVARVAEKVEPFLLGTSVTFYRLNELALLPDYFFVVLQSPVWQGQLEAIMAQTTRNQVSIQKQAFFKIPLPPLAEQHRIVAKVDALMALCDRLEAALTTAETTRARLLEALLHEALAPNRATLEAAE
jgi:type I restriction enzyme S subunit